MLYFKKDSEFTIVFSDKHYRLQAVKDLEIISKNLYGKVLLRNDYITEPPYLKLRKSDIASRLKLFEFGVQIDDSNGSKWEAAMREQAIDAINANVAANVADSVNIEAEKILNDIINQLLAHRINFKRIDDDPNNILTVCPFHQPTDFNCFLNINSGLFKCKVSTCQETGTFDEFMKKNMENSNINNNILHQYVKDACRTECSYEDATLRATKYIDLLHGVIGLCTEIGELQDQVKRYIFYGKSLDVVNVEEELGDFCWYIAIICNSLNLDWNVILNKNIDKLKARYPDKFTEDKAINRNLDEERKVLNNE